MNHYQDQVLNALAAWKYDCGERGAKKVRGHVEPHGLHICRPELVGFIRRTDGTHVFLMKNAARLGYARDYFSEGNWPNIYKDGGEFLLEITDQNGRKGYVLPENVRWSS